MELVDIAEKNWWVVVGTDDDLSLEAHRIIGLYWRDPITGEPTRAELLPIISDIVKAESADDAISAVLFP